VLHALPGRVRIHLPVLKRAPLHDTGAVDLVARVLSAPAGITEVVPCVVTGNVLVRFDEEQLEADDVLRYFRAATRLCVTNRDLLENLTPTRLQEAEERLCEWLRGRLSYRLNLDGNSKIPEHVLE
jgi:hypothetical protein